MNPRIAVPLSSASWLTARRVDLLLGAAVAAAGVSGLVAWAVGSGWGRWVTLAHAFAGLAVLALAPAKLKGSVRTGMRRRRATRLLSVLLGLAVLSTVALGVLHATGLWHGVGYWSALWTHVLLAALLSPLLVWHVVSRPSRVRPADLDRRTLLGGGAAVAAAGAVYGIQQLLVGDNRRFTGSHEIASFEPERMPTTMWLNDRSPRLAADDWELLIAGRRVELADLQDRARPLQADLDCTGGWWSRQSWDAAPLAELMPDISARSIEVASVTGYSRLFPADDAGNLHLAVGYNGEPLRRGHGAPVRLVAPGRRGFWWVKWVGRVDLRDRPWWLQLPFPLE
ncbi:MAG: molybdopterin-dependent oxidoreductase [Acidimicrobiaceae bacterium]|nr:molybdopterin-dependent oxidoreductase [Acidimicrobiaceae bacterium]